VGAASSAYTSILLIFATMAATQVQHVRAIDFTNFLQSQECRVFFAHQMRKCSTRVVVVHFLGHD